MVARGTRTQQTLVWIALASAALCVLCAPSRMKFVRASDGRAYTVKASADAAAVAERLAELQRVATRFLRACARRFPGEGSELAARVLRKWDGTISEVPGDDEVAYSLDKNSVAVCVRSRDGGAIETMNRSMFVLLHEFAHIATPELGHTPAFWRNMKVLLEMADRLGVYRDDEHLPDATYCGHPLGISPMSCVRERTCSSTLPR
jgi:hypothetical protein